MGVRFAMFLVLLWLHLTQLREFVDQGDRAHRYDFNQEGNLPTAYAAMILGFAAYLLFYIGQWPYTKTYRAQ